MQQLDTGGPPRRRGSTWRKWLVSRDNPLTARVVVNRLWKHVLRRRACRRCCIDMGSQGEVPPNQELLDWLAVEFMDSGWDMKHMIRLMVTSSAYRQSSLPRPEVDAIDPDNRLVARQSRFRLEAEQIRDNALAVSGLLVNKLGGEIVEAVSAGEVLLAAQFPGARLHAVDGRRSIPPGRVRALAAAVPAPVAAGVRRADARGVHGPAADFQHADGGAGAAERSVVRRSGASAGGTSSGEAHQPTTDSGFTGPGGRCSAATPSRPRSNVLAKLAGQTSHTVHGRCEGAPRRSLTVGISPQPKGVDAAELAAWTSVSRVLLNLNETITRN